MCLDANVVVDLIRGRADVGAELRSRLAGGESVVVSSVAYEELVYGSGLSARPEIQRQVLELALSSIEVESLTREDASRIGEYRMRQRRAGRPLSAYDGLLAGHAHARGWILVTSDQRLVESALDLQVENWRTAA